MIIAKKKDGFNGEKLISLPKFIYEHNPDRLNFLNSLYITHIGYFPKAGGHYRNRPKGCADNILIYCIDGKGSFSIGKVQYQVSPNQFFIIPATDEHVQYSSDPADPWTIYWVHFTGSKLPDLNDSICDCFSPKTIPFDEHKLKLWNIMYNCLENGYSAENLTYANLTLYYFIANFLFPKKNTELISTPNPELTDKIIDYMKANLAKKLSVEDLAMEFSYSVSHFQNLFRKKTGVSAIDYFIQLKLQKACQLLALTDLRIKVIASSIGYSDPYYFSRIFNKVMGMSPIAYRKINTISNQD
ncbi:AraC family transcriptional regulator [Pedobacter gandavensis]|uniref:AraC family transcriptional regulator n=1 Tax=Pedobacter gandavensis TaxID=2679963 RepID=UPI0029308746|nr:AraC family transcriptional regulator [Pedobacter gandavensis]